jgi:hypothetical protein
MADEKPPQASPEEEAKKDTVRINLPPGLSGRPAHTGPPGSPPPAKLKPPTAPSSPEDEAKRETAVMGTPIATPKPKKDTSRVQVSAAKPVAAEVPRPTVKLKRDEGPPSSGPTSGGVPMSAPSSAAPVVVSSSSGADAGLALGAMLLSLAVLGYLAWLTMG